MSEYEEISKILSKNDVGETKAHQAGMLIPKNPPEVLAFFPELDATKKNPRKTLSFWDNDGVEWKFNFIYYNNKLFGGTRNEYRLTGFTSFFRRHRLKSGDEIVFRKDREGIYYINYWKKLITSQPIQKESVLELSGKWRIIPMSIRRR